MSGVLVLLVGLMAIFIAVVVAAASVAVFFLAVDGLVSAAGGLTDSLEARGIDPDVLLDDEVN